MCVFLITSLPFQTEAEASNIFRVRGNPGWQGKYLQSSFFATAEAVSATYAHVCADTSIRLSPVGV